MYTRRKAATARVIPAAEPKKSPSPEKSHSDEDQKTKKSPRKKSSSPSPRKKAKEEDKNLFREKQVYIVPVELPKVRRDLLARRIEENGGTVLKKFEINAKKSGQPDYIVVDDRVGMETLCRALDKDYPESKRLLDVFNNSGLAVVRAKWISSSLRKKKLAEDSEGKINDFLQNHLLALNKSDVDELPERGKDAPLRKYFDPADRDQSPERGDSYHSDNDHKSDISDISDIDDVSNDGKDDSEKSAQRNDRAAGNLKKNNFFLSPAGSSKKGGVNQHIIDQLEEMMTAYRNMGDEFRTYAYARAISSIRKYPDPILGPEQIKELKNVGPRLASHILEIVETGQCEKLHENSINEEAAAMKLFVNIHGVGTKTAKKWVHMGMRTLEDIKAKVPLTPEQTVGLRYYDEFQAKMPRKEVEDIAEIVEKAVSSLKSGFIFQVCGSYRRGRELCGDVDLLMTHPDGRSHETILKPLLERLHEDKFLTDDLFLADQRHKKYFGVCKLPEHGAKHRRLDIIIPPYKEWATCVLGWSGSMYFVRSIREYAHKKGMALTDYSLNKNVVRVNGEKVSEGDPLDTPTEESIFQALGLSYLRPEERDH